MVQLRFGQSPDLPQLMTLAAKNAWSIQAPEDQQDFRRLPAVAEAAQSNLLGMLSTPGGNVFVADVGGQIGAYLLVGIGPDSVTGAPFGYLADVWVHPQLRNHGVGQALVRSAESYLQQLGITRAKAWVHAHNAAPQRLLTGLGYKPEGIIMDRDLRATPLGAALPAGLPPALPTGLSSALTAVLPTLQAGLPPALPFGTMPAVPAVI